MNGDIPYITIISIYILSFNVLSTNSRTSTLWKLNEKEDKIVEASPFHQVVTSIIPGGAGDGQFVTDDDPVFNIITSTVHFGQFWTKQGLEYNYCTDCKGKDSAEKYDKNSTVNSLRDNHNSATIADDEVLDCGKSVNFTYYDSLAGVANRHMHPLVPEPKVAQIFTKKKNKGDLDVNALERRLKKAKREKPKSVQLYNQIGNFWRIKGDAHKSIECFRRALAVSPHNAEVLLNLAKVLFAVQYYDDAIYVAQRSLEVQPPDKNAWQQYFTLGEIFKASGRHQEASIHLRHTLELRPDYEPAVQALKEVDASPETDIHMYTLVIIILLVVGVILVIVATVDHTKLNDNDAPEVRPTQQRHFNRAMAMRRMSLTSRTTKTKKTAKKKSL